MLVRGISGAIRLDDHHGQAVGDDVVQFARDPMALRERLELRVRRSLAFLLDRPLALELRPLAGRSDLVTERPDEHEECEARHEHGTLRRRQERQRVRQEVQAVEQAGRPGPEQDVRRHEGEDREPCERAAAIRRHREQGGRQRDVPERQWLADGELRERRHAR